MTIVVGDREPSLGCLAEVGANLVECLALSVTARKCGDGGGIAACVRFWADNRRENYGHIDDDRLDRGSGAAHG
jgi:hypothetical protein